MWIEKSFNLNDWVVIISILFTWVPFLILPKLFDKGTVIIIILFGLTVSSVLDNSLGTDFPIDLYDIMDGPKYTVMDLLVYFLYQPFAYFFLYFYKLLIRSTYSAMLYILIWSLFSVLVETLFVRSHVFTYKNGYNIYYSFCIYLLVQSMLLWFYSNIRRKT